MGLLVLAGQALATFAASFITGYLPLAFKAISGKRLNIISVFGMGLLVGAALTIIIPEGVSTLFSSLPENNNLDGIAAPTHVIGIALLAGFALMMMVESLTPHPSNHSEEDRHHTDAESGHYHQVSRPPSPSPPQTAGDGRFPLRSTNSHLNNDDEPARRSAERLDSSTHLFPKKKPAMETRKSTRSRRDSNPCVEEGEEEERERIKNGVAGLNATLGLVIHAMADGIALGASSLSESGGLGFVVFLAVIVHKGPTALGLTTTLLSLGLSHPQIRNRLLIFSASAPAGAVLTYLLIKLFGGSNGTVHKGDVDSLQWWTGVVLLFSGGSFLYVATVISPLSDSDSHNTHAHAHKHDPEDEQLSKPVRLSLLVGGMVLPLILSAVLGDHDH